MIFNCKNTRKVSRERDNSLLVERPCILNRDNSLLVERPCILNRDINDVTSFNKINGNLI